MQTTIQQPWSVFQNYALGRWAFAILIGIDVLVNALLGGHPYQTISARIGVSIRANGWAARVPWPQWWRQHCENSIFLVEV